MISVGQNVGTLLNEPANPAWMDYSIEFCGGTHLTNTAQAEDFVMVEESGIAKVGTEHHVLMYQPLMCLHTAVFLRALYRVFAV